MDVDLKQYKLIKLIALNTLLIAFAQTISGIINNHLHLVFQTGDCIMDATTVALVILGAINSKKLSKLTKIWKNKSFIVVLGYLFIFSIISVMGFLFNYFQLHIKVSNLMPFAFLDNCMIRFVTIFLSSLIDNLFFIFGISFFIVIFTIRWIIPLLDKIIEEMIKEDTKNN